MEDFNEINNEPTSTMQPPSPFRSMFGKMTSDMRFVGLFTIIYGAINCLSIIGAVIGVTMIFIGIRMREAADQKILQRTAGIRNESLVGRKVYRVSPLAAVGSATTFVRDRPCQLQRAAGPGSDRGGHADERQPAGGEIPPVRHFHRGGPW